MHKRFSYFSLEIFNFMDVKSDTLNNSIISGYQYIKVIKDLKLKHIVKRVLSGHSKRRPKMFFKTDYHLMQVKSIAECSKRAFCNTFDLH